MTSETPEEQVDHLEAVVDALDRTAHDEIRELVAELHPADIADLVEALPPEQRFKVWSKVAPENMGEILLEVSDGVRADLISKLDSPQLVTAVRGLDTDDIADLLPELPDEVTAEIMFVMDRASREQLHTVLSYPEDTAGGLMNVDTITVRENLPLAAIIRYLRRRGELPEYTNRLFVIDHDGRLTGSLLLSDLLINEDTRRVGEIMERETFSFDAMATNADVASAFEKYDLITAPVLDEEKRLLGRITVDDVVDVIRDEADHSVMARAGLSEEEDIFAPVAQSTRGRAVWLGVNLITAFIASWAIGQFQETIGQLVALAVLMPIVASMGGNAGTQTLTIVIRGLAMGTITSSNARRVLRKELLVGGLNGLIWAAVVALVATLWFHDYHLGLIIAVAMIINLVFSALSGVLLPFVFRRFGIDPALAGGVALTTVTDVVGFVAFLGLAAIFLV